MIGSYIKVCRPRKKDGEGERWAMGGVSPTMNAFDNSDTRSVVAVVHCYENHAQDSRVKDCGEVRPQINAKAGTGGGNLPILKWKFTR